MELRVDFKVAYERNGSVIISTESGSFAVEASFLDAFSTHPMNQKQTNYANHLERQYGKKIADVYRGFLCKPDYFTKTKCQTEQQIERQDTQNLDAFPTHQMNPRQQDYANYLERQYGKKIANRYRNLVSSPDYFKGGGYQTRFRRNYRSQPKKAG